MIYRALSPSGDYQFGKNLQSFLSGNAAVGQAIRTRLLLLRGEWWEDISEGLPLFTQILGRPGSTSNIQSVDLIIRQSILSTPGVLQITSFSSSYINREYSVSCSVSTKFGGTVSVGVTF